MKAMKLITLVETTMGPLEVKTQSVPWIWTVLTFGLFKKAVCQIDGPALNRYFEIRRQSAEKMKSALGSPKVFHTTFWRVAFWHEHTVEYVQNQGSVMSEHHHGLQWFDLLANAILNNDPERARGLIEEEMLHGKKRMEQLRRSRPQRR